MNSKFACFFFFKKNILVRTNTPKHRKKMEFTEFFEERSGGVAASQATTDWEMNEVYGVKRKAVSVKRRG